MRAHRFAGGGGDAWKEMFTIRPPDHQVTRGRQLGNRLRNRQATWCSCMQGSCWIVWLHGAATWALQPLILSPSPAPRGVVHSLLMRLLGIQAL